MSNKKKNKFLKKLTFLLFWILSITFLVLNNESIVFEKYFTGVVNSLSLRYLLFLFLISVWYTLGSKRFFLNLLFLIGFPLYVLFWIIPRYIFVKKYWIMIYSCFQAILYNIIHYKLQLIKLVLFTCGLVLVFKTNVKPILYIVLVSQLFLLIVLIIEKFKVACRPANYFMINDDFSTLDEEDKKAYCDKIIRKVYPEIVDDQNINKEKQLNKIEVLVVTGIAAAFLSSRLRDFLSRRTYIILFFLKTLTAFVFAWFLLALMNYTLYKASYSEYILQIFPQFYHFIFYTFHSMLHGGIQEIIPSGAVAHIINIIAPIISLLFTGILLTIYISVKSDQYQVDVKKVIPFIEMVLERLKKLLLDNYQLTMEEALSFLESNKSIFCSTIKAIKKIT